MTARICLKLRRPRRAYDALAAVNAIDVRQIADSDRTAEQITNIAAVLCAQRLRAEAKDVLRSAIALAPRAAAPRSALILLLEEDLRAAGGNISLEQWAELKNLLRKSVIESPHLAAPRLALAACLGQEARYREAQTAPVRVVAPILRVEAENLLREAVAEEPCGAAPHLLLLSSCWKTFDMWRLRPLPRQRCGLVQLVQNCAWFLRESSSNSCNSRRPQKRSRRCLPSLPRMDGLGSNTARSCGTPSTGPIAPSSAPEIFRETMALCWQASLNGFYTISITRKLRSITSDFSIFIRTCGTIL